MEDLYHKWLKYLFDRPETKPEWYWDIELEDFDATPEETVRLIGMLFERSGTDLDGCSNIQIVRGLKYIFDNCISNVIFTIIDKGVDEELRIETVLKMKHLYKDCLAKHCENVISHDDHVKTSPLNGFCYMLWDITPLGSWKSVVLEVMEYALYIPNDACIESGLHGLGHSCYQHPEKVPEIIDRFLAKSKSLNPQLRQYAQNARTGRIL